MLIVKSIATPIVWVLALLALGMLLPRFAKKKLSLKVFKTFVPLAMLALFVFSIPPVSNLLTYSLECRYRPLSSGALGTLDVIVVLGGGIHPSGEFGEEAELSGVSYSRCFNGVRIFLQSNADLLALCGGRSRKNTESEAEVMKAMAVNMGVSKDQILIEPQSHNTMENAVLLERLLPPGRKRQIGVVTSATHMLRSEKVFRKVFPDDIIVPIPVNYTYNPMVWAPSTFVPSAGALSESTVALHEWFGVIWYSLRY